MTQRFREIAFTPAVRAAQANNGSADIYADTGPADGDADELTPYEMTFISLRDSFYFATVSASGWPYMQHRGGPPGFVKILGRRTIGIADYRGNQQYVSLGNLADNNRASLFFMDYMNRHRLKVLARARVVDLTGDPELTAELSDAAYEGRLERGILFEVEAFDWNCPKYITPRFTEAELRKLTTR
ncbi:MAG: pyridoxamine 5'-phosphate oxidase family protein [Hyphomicrobiaceae bacterium]